MAEQDHKVNGRPMWQSWSWLNLLHSARAAPSRMAKRGLATADWSIFIIEDRLQTIILVVRCHSPTDWAPMTRPMIGKQLTADTDEPGTDSWSWHKTASSPSEIMSNMVCEIWLGIGEIATVIISKWVVWLDSRLLHLCIWSVLP